MSPPASATSVRDAGGDPVLAAVLRVQERRAELVVLKGCLIGAVFGIVLTLVGHLLLDRGKVSLLFLVLSSGSAAWFSIALLLRSRGRGHFLVQVGNVVMLAMVPWLVLVVYALMFNFERAAGTWEPVMFLTGFSVLSILWTRPWVPLFLGVLGAVQYVALWLITTPVSTWSALPTSSPILPGIVAYRALLLLGLGGFCAFGAMWMRRAVAAAAKDLRSRDLFGKYRLAEPLGQGGMGTVVKAVYCPEGGFERQVAIKRIHPHIAARADVMARFRAEAELGSRLVHPNIVSVLDFGSVDGTYFFAMEFVDGPALGEVMVRARSAKELLPTGFVARVAQQLCAGLRYAHEDAVDPQGQPLRVVHRDLCPWNVLVARSGQVKITDFGIARVLGNSQDDRTTHILGKAGYMAPELLQTEPFDARADLFSLGVLIWEMLCGERLFGRSNLAATALAVCDASVPRPSSRRPGLDRGWDQLVLKLLARDPGDRFRSATEVEKTVLERLRAEGSPDADEIRTVVDRIAGPAKDRIHSEVTAYEMAELELTAPPTEEDPRRVPRLPG